MGCLTPDGGVLTGGCFVSSGTRSVVCCRGCSGERFPLGLGWTTLSTGAPHKLSGECSPCQVDQPDWLQSAIGEASCGPVRQGGRGCDRSDRRLGFPLLPLVAEAIDIRPLLSDPLPLRWVHGLESPRTVRTRRRLIDRRVHDIPHE